MTGITSAVTNLFSSLLGVITYILNVILAVFQSSFAVLATGLQDIFGLVKWLAGFILSNILVIGLLGAAFVAYTAYQQRQGRPVSTVGSGRGTKKGS